MEKIDHARRRIYRYTHWQTWQTDANRFYNLSHAICYSYGTDKTNTERRRRRRRRRRASAYVWERLKAVDEPDDGRLQRQSDRRCRTDSESDRDSDIQRQAEHLPPAALTAHWSRVSRAVPVSSSLIPIDRPPTKTHRPVHRGRWHVLGTIWQVHTLHCRCRHAASPLWCPPSNSTMERNDTSRERLITPVPDNPRSINSLARTAQDFLDFLNFVSSERRECRN